MLASLIMRLCVLRANPQDLPTSPVLLGAALLAHFALDVLTLHDAYSPTQAIIGAAVDTSLLVALVHTTLLLRNLGSRTLQTLTALGFIGALFSALAWLATALLDGLLPANAVWGAFLVWYLVVFGHVARNALSVSLPAGVAIALAYFMLSALIVGSVLGEPVSALPGGGAG